MILDDRCQYIQLGFGAYIANSFFIFGLVARIKEYGNPLSGGIF